MRGKVTMTQKLELARRITPAYAGKSASDISAASFKRDHPRLCGEKIVRPWICRLTRGSPPPMRGKDDGTLPEPISNRITPAYAVKSHAFKKSAQYNRGSPPPMRGKVWHVWRKHRTYRITPAYAGKRLPIANISKTW